MDKNIPIKDPYPLRLRDCIKYDECLDDAAFQNKPKFSCEGCRKYEKKDNP